MISGLHPLRLFHETTATALAYGIYKTDLPENDQLNVAFIDVGHASMQVCIAGYKKGQLKVLAHLWDGSLGRQDFDEALFKHFTAKFKEEFKIDVYQNARACLRLRAACEKLKKMLSANPEAPLNIECLMDEKDVRGFIKREDFENISVPILERVKGLLEKALVDAGLIVENIHTVKVVGSGSRVPAIIKILTEFNGKEPRRTMNASVLLVGLHFSVPFLAPHSKCASFRYSGPTVHYVDEKFDTGRILAQRVVPVLADDTAEQLAARVRREEHKVYVEVVSALCEERIVCREDGVPLIRSREIPDEYS